MSSGSGNDNEFWYIGPDIEGDGLPTIVLYGDQRQMTTRERMCQKIVELHMVDLALKGKPGEIAVFTYKLPRYTFTEIVAKVVSYEEPRYSAFEPNQYINLN